MTRVSICIPSFDDWKADFGFDLAGMVLHTATVTQGLEIGLKNHRLSNLPTSRNRMVYEACMDGCHYILFLDSDMRFPVDTLVRLLKHNVDIAAANCVQRAFPTRATAWKESAHLFTETGSTGLEEVEAIGTAVMLINTRVFENFPPPWFLFEPFPDKPLDSLGEDQFFCREARKHGFKVLIDHDLSKQVYHVGTFAYGHQHAVACRDKTPVLLNDLGLNTLISPRAVVKEKSGGDHDLR